MYNKYIIYIYIYSVISTSWHVGLLGSQHKCHTKRCLEFKNNAVSHMTFSEQLACQLVQ